MESVLFVGIDIKVVARDAATGQVRGEDWLEVPPAVDASRVEQYVLARFGDPVDVAMGRTDRFGEIVTGWIFPSELLDPLGLPSELAEMLVVPYVRFDDGSRRELFEYNVELHNEFAALAAQFDRSAAAISDVAPREANGRLDQEQLRLVNGERDDVELQVSGWLTRMLDDGWTYLIIELPETGRYVQFLTHDGDWLRGEVVGDRYLEGHLKLSPDELQRLRDLGWNRPGEDPDDCGNHWVDWGDPADEHGARLDVRDVDEAARFAAATLCDVFGPVDPGRCEVLVGTASTDDPASAEGD